MPWSFGPQGATGFPQRCAQWLLDGAREFGAGTDTALDVGCAVGRASFELARGYREVTGVDLSRAFIDAAQAVQRNGELRYFRKDEGELGARSSATIDPAIDRTRVSFRQADATSLPADWLDFDAVLLANLLCRLPSPKSLLGRLGGARGLVKVGGLVAIFSPYTWLEQFTPRGAWLGGMMRDGKPVNSADALREFLGQKALSCAARTRCRWSSASTHASTSTSSPARCCGSACAERFRARSEACRPPGRFGHLAEQIPDHAVLTCGGVAGIRADVVAMPVDLRS